MVKTRTLTIQLAAPALLLALQGCGGAGLELPAFEPAAEGPPPPSVSTTAPDDASPSDGRDPRGEIVVVGDEGPPGGPTGDQERLAEPVEHSQVDDRRPPVGDRAPTPIVPASVATDEDMAIGVLLTAVDDHDAEAALSVTIVEMPAHGTLSAAEGPAPLSVTYTPAADYAGPDSIRVVFADQTKHASSPVEIPILVHPANDAPRLATLAVEPTLEDRSLHQVVEIVDPEGDDVTVTLEGAPAWLQSAFDSPALTLTGVPGDADVGEVVITVVAVDGWGARARLPVTLSIVGVEEPPSIEPLDIPPTIDEDAPFSLLLRADDPEDAGPPYWASSTLPAWASLTDFGDGTARVEGTPDDADHGHHTFAFTATDVAGLSNTLDFELEVLPVNDAPVAVTDHFYTLGNVDLVVEASTGQIRVGPALTQMQHFGVLANDTDVDSAGRFAVSETVDSDAGGTASIAVTGGVTYSPPRGFVGEDRFTYRVRDTGGAEGSGDVVVHVAQGAWFVDPVAGSAGTGTWAAPMSSIQDALHDAAPGDVVFVRGSALTPLPVEILLAPGQTLIGEGAGLTLTLATPTGIEPIQLVPPGPAPTLTNPTGDIVTLADNTTVAGFVMSGAGGSGLLADGVADITLRALLLVDNDEAALHIVGGRGDWTLSDIDVSGGGVGLQVSASPELVLSATDLIVTGTGNEGLAFDGIGGADLFNTVISGPGGDAFRLSGSDQATVAVDGLDIDVTQAFALVASDVGQLVLRTASLEATHSGVLHVSRVALDAELEHLSSTGAAGDAVAIYASSGQVDVSAFTVENGAGASLLINTSPDLRFEANDVALSAERGVDVSASPTAEVQLALAGDLVATSGDALALDDAGHFTLSGNFAIAAQGGAACRASATDLDIEVRAMHASDGDVGVALDGTSGDLSVTGDGSDAPNHSGGEISNCTSDSVRVNGGSASLRQMRLVGAADRGVAVAAEDDRDSLVHLAHTEVDDHAVGVEVVHSGGGLVSVHLEGCEVHTTAGANVAVTSTGAGDTSVTLDATQLDGASGDTSFDAFRAGAEGALCVAANGTTADKRLAFTAEDEGALFVAGYSGSASDDDAVEAFLSAANSDADVQASADTWPTPVADDACPLP